MAKLLAIKGGDIAMQFRCASVPNAPARMLHAIFQRRTVALRRVAPVMFRDEFLFRAFKQRLRFALKSNLQISFPGL